MHTTRDLANLLQLMQTSRQSGDLMIEPSVQNGTPWRGQMRFVDGKVVSCQVQNKIDGHALFHDNEAMRWLVSTDRGKLQWSLEEPAPLPGTFLPPPPANEDSGRDEHSSMGRTNPYPTAQSPSIYNTYPESQDNRSLSKPYSSGQSIQSGTILRRTESGNKAPVLSSRELRQVFSLVDGHRTVEEIVNLLHKSPDLVVRLLNDLKSARLVE